MNELPPPPPGKSGWPFDMAQGRPWTEENPQLPDTMPGGSPWPKVSIVTPSYNQGQFIEESIRSVLLQGYPDLEYIIIDGGSTDGSVDIIRKYEPWLTFWVSEPDQGQAHAISKGWGRSTGPILAYLNSDDTYLPHAITKAVQAFTISPRAAAICGGELQIDAEGTVIAAHRVQSATLLDLLHFHFIPQPAVFFRRSALEEASGLDLSFQFVFDFELWTRVAQYGNIQCVDSILATTRWHPQTKTLTQRPKIIEELERVVHKALSSTAGRRLSQREQRVIWARLSLLLTAIYLEDAAAHRGLAVASALSAIRRWPPIAPSLAYLFIARSLPEPLMRMARCWKRHVTEALGKSTEQGNIPWGQWQDNI